MLQIGVPSKGRKVKVTSLFYTGTQWSNSRVGAFTAEFVSQVRFIKTCLIVAWIVGTVLIS